MDEHFGCLHALAVVNSAAVDVGLHVSFLKTGFSECMLKSGMTGRYGH